MNSDLSTYTDWQLFIQINTLSSSVKHTINQTVLNNKYYPCVGRCHELYIRASELMKRHPNMSAIDIELISRLES